MSLSSKQRQADKALETARKAESRQRAQQEAYRLGSHDPGRPPAFGTRIRQAQEQVEEARKQREATQAHQERAKKAVQGISDLQRIQKAQRVVVEMVATIAFFWLTVRAKEEALALAPEGEQAVYDSVIPARYLELVAQKAKHAEQRFLLRKRAEALRTPLCARDGPWSSLTEEERSLIEQVATTCAQLWLSGNFRGLQLPAFPSKQGVS